MAAYTAPPYKLLILKTREFLIWQTPILSPPLYNKRLRGNDKSANLDKTEHLIRDAVEKGAELVVLQRLHATQYFCQEENTDYFDMAESLDGYTYTRCAQLAEELDIV